MKTLIFTMLLFLSFNVFSEDKPVKIVDGTKIYNFCLNGHLWSLAVSSSGIVMVQVYTSSRGLTPIPVPVKCD